jgi:hypothetical protein
MDIDDFFKQPQLSFRSRICFPDDNGLLFGGLFSYSGKQIAFYSKEYKTRWIKTEQHLN